MVKMEVPQPQPLSGETDDQRDIRLNKDIAAFGYIWILSIAVYVSKRDSRFAQFHSKQGIVLFLFTIPIGLIPMFGKYLMLLPLAGMLLGFINAAQGQERDVPIVGPLSRGEMNVADLLKMVLEIAKNMVQSIKSVFKKSSSSASSASSASSLSPISPTLIPTPTPTPIPNPNPNPHPHPHPQPPSPTPTPTPIPIPNPNPNP